MTLSALEETALLTIHCHTVAGPRLALDTAVAEWMLGELGRPAFAADLAWRTVSGVAARAALIDAWVKDAILRSPEPITYLSLGCGFDYRWYKLRASLGSKIAQYIEIDQPALIEAKEELLARSPYADAYAAVERRPGNLADPEILPRSDRPTLVVLEGVIDYMGREGKLDLLRRIRERAPRHTLILDALNAWAVRMNNKNSRGATGSASLGFSWAPDRPTDFYTREAKYRVVRSASILRETLAVKTRLLRLVPLPRKMREASTLLELEPEPES
jgi:O-methyltransferase involved in polyketide biosynthesis